MTFMHFTMTWIEFAVQHSLWGLGFVGLLVAGWSRWRRQPVWGQTATIWSFYAWTLCLTALILDSHWEWIYLFRYFVYLASGLLMFGIPLIFMGIVLLLVLDLWSEASLQGRGSDLVILTSLSVLILGTIWLVWHRWDYDLMLLVSVYVTLALYFIANFLAFVGLTLYYAWRPSKGSPQALVILGTEVDQEGQVSPLLRARLDRALLFLMGNSVSVPILVTGGRVKGTAVTEASQMARYLEGHGVPRNQIYLEDRALNTDQNIRHSLELLGSCKPWLLVTSKFHLVRTAHYLDYYRVSADFLGSNTPWYLWPYSLVREYIALVMLAKEVHFLVGLFLVLFQLWLY